MQDSKEEVPGMHRDEDGLLVPIVPIDPKACPMCSGVAGRAVYHPGECPVAQGHRLCVTPHVATLPDGEVVNLPAGTVLREGEARGVSTYRIAAEALVLESSRARALLRRVRTLLAKTGSADLLAEVEAFLTGAPPAAQEGKAPAASMVGRR
jgi:hypothetical protein